MNLACPNCGFENPRAWRACARCGHSLVTKKGQPLAPTVVPPPAGVDTAVELHPFLAEVPDTHVDASYDAPAPPPDAATAADGSLVAVEPTEETEPPLIGQAEAAEAIRSGIERAFSLGIPTLVTLEGGAGSGKTRLLTYASEVAARTATNVRVLYAACREGGDGPYAPLSRLLLERFGVTPASAPSAVRALMATAIAQILGTVEASQVAETTHLLGHVAGVPFPDSPFLASLEGEPEQLRKRAASAVRRLFEGDGKQRPILLLFDNMHWAESEAWQLVQAILEASAPIAVVIAGGPPAAEEASKLTPAGGVAIGPIEPLSDTDVASLLSVLLPRLTSAPEPLVAALSHRTRGNPKALRELVLSLVEAGLFVPSPESPDSLTVDLEQLERGNLPVTTEDAIRSRLERLDALERATIERAAIVGEVFWDRALLAQMRGEREPPGEQTDPASLWPDDEDELALTDALARLEDKGFIERIRESDLPGVREYVFAYGGTRAIVGADEDEALKIRRHNAIARWLNTLAEGRRQEIAALIAPHLERAGLKARAGRAWLEAAAYERRKLRTTMALRYIEKALPLIENDDVVRRLDALHEHGSLLTTLGRYDDAIHAFGEMLRLSWQAGARNKGGAALNRIARVYRQRGEESKAKDLLERALALFRAAGDLRGVAATLDDLAQVIKLQGELDPANAAVNEALEIRRAHGDRRGEAVSLTTLGTIELARGNFDVAEECLRKALEIRREIGDHEGTMQSHNAIGVLAYERGNVDIAIESWRQGLELAREIADRRSESFLLSNLGEALLAAGKVTDAQESLEQARTLAQQLQDLRASAEVERLLGLVALKRGDDEASRLLARALELAEQYGGREAIGLAQRAIGQLRARTLFDESGAVNKSAEESFLASIESFRAIGNEREVARSLTELGQHLIERGDTEGARSRLQEALGIMQRIGLAESEKIARTLSELGA